MLFIYNFFFNIVHYSWDNVAHPVLSVKNVYIFLLSSGPILRLEANGPNPRRT